MHNLIADYLHCHPARVHFMLSKGLKTCREKNIRIDAAGSCNAAKLNITWTNKKVAENTWTICVMETGHEIKES